MTRTPFLVLFVPLVAALAGCGDSVDVSVRRTEGESLAYLRSVEVEGVVPTSGKKMRSREEFTTKEKSLEVVPGERTTLGVTIDRTVVEMFSDGPKPLASFDTAAKEEPAKGPAKAPETMEEKFAYQAELLRWLSAGKVEVEVKHSGMVLRVVGAEDINKVVLDHLAPDDPRRPMAEKYPWAVLIRGFMTPAVCVLERGMTPGVEVKFRDLRTLPEGTGAMGIMYYSGTYRLAKVEDGVARLEMEADVFLDPPSPEMPAWPPAMVPYRNRLRLQKGTCRAWARIRVADGVLLEDEHRTSLDLFYVKPDGSGELPDATTVTQRAKLLK